ncbi:universal stress protein [Dactylosporangium sucinum]|uniref:Universal stress protein n=1 Tax=Dactylosporangium sucinum TaxID=1424081 RepID=A0A917UBU4_9ACTN|nr:universal stress protein [Dactylosporangium sucinum]GGM77229.1 universal stress protein [Dactylosporangium sucinum]GGM77960.1 universal stress protein [Dactylosporangium sucinum]
METQRIVVGYDGSVEARDAVDWAADEAARTGAPLRIVYAYQLAWPAAAMYGQVTEVLATEAEERGDHTVRDIVEHVRRRRPTVEVTGSAVHAEPAPLLLGQAAGTRLLVVGNRGGGGMTNLLLGSISQQVATHARTPVAVVRGRAGTTDGPVVVGVDGSGSTDAALALAFEAAVARGAEVIAVRAYSPPSPAVVPLSAVEADERAALEASLAGWAEKYPGTRLTALLAVGRAARVLVGMSHTAQLVVVGSRGHGGFTGLLLGSVGQQLMHHAECPILIAHRPDDH